MSQEKDTKPTDLASDFATADGTMIVWAWIVLILALISWVVWGFFARNIHNNNIDSDQTDESDRFWATVFLILAALLTITFIVLIFYGAKKRSVEEEKKCLAQQQAKQMVVVRQPSVAFSQPIKTVDPVTSRSVQAFQQRQISTDLERRSRAISFAGIRQPYESKTVVPSLTSNSI